MAVIQLKGLSAREAETAIARIWRVLERHGIESPRIAVRPDGGDRISIEVIFRSQRDADAVAILI